MILILKAKHFKNAKFYICADCAIARAYMDQTGNQCYERVDHIYDFVTKQTLIHRDYLKEHFEEDHAMAFFSNYDERVIRKIKLKP